MSDSVFEKLYNIDCTPYFETVGHFDGVYLPWARAWSVLKKLYPDATYEVKRFAGDVPYLKTELGYFVEVSVTVEGRTETELYAVTDSKFHSIDKPDTRDITDSFQRALVKAIARHGLGLSAWEREKHMEPKKQKVEKELHTQTIENAQDYVCKVKKFQGKKMKDLKDFEILNYITWLKQNTELKWPEQKEFVEYGEAYLKDINPEVAPDFDVLFHSKK